MRRLAWANGRAIWTVVLIALLVVFSYAAGREGLSNFYAQSARMEIERLAKPGAARANDRNALAQHYLEQSLRYSARNPWPLEERGALQLRMIASATDPARAVQAARSANAAFRLVLRERPVSSFAWANLALSKLYLDEQDAELLQALEYAETLGPWEPDVQQTVTYLGFAMWHRLDAKQRTLVLRAMARAAVRNPAGTARIAKSFERMALFCAISGQAPQTQNMCASFAKSAK